MRDVSERKRLEAAVLELARTDHLTGLLNRRAGQELVDRETARCRRSRHGLGFVLLDIDHFKQINDSAGHAGGDQVLQQLGALLRERIRGTDIALRWGGEEFLIVLPDTDEGGARVLAEALRRRVETTRFTAVAQVTVSTRRCGAAGRRVERSSHRTRRRQAVCGQAQRSQLRRGLSDR